MEFPKVTIWIPSYNHEQYLPLAIESALAQTYPNIEILIVDDGSTDGSLAIAENYATLYPSKIKVFSHLNNKNLGISATVNECFRRSVGYYCSGLPSDDRLLPDKIERQVLFLQSHPDVAWVYSPAYYIDNQGKRVPGVFGEDFTNCRYPLEKLIAGNCIPGMTVLARRDCLERVGLHNENLVYSDWEFWVRLAALYKVGFISTPTVEYRIHNYNTSIGIDNKQNLRRCLEVLQVLQQNGHRYGGDLDKQRLQVLIICQQIRILFYLGEEEEASKLLGVFFEKFFLHISDLKTLSEWFKHSYDIPEFYAWLITWTFKEVNLPNKQKLLRRLYGFQYSRESLRSFYNGDFNHSQKKAIQTFLVDIHWLLDFHLISVFAQTLLSKPMSIKLRNLKRLLGRIEWPNK